MTPGGPVFLTGATGFIGRRLAVALSARGYRLRCLVRDPARAEPLRALGAELVEGDVVSAATLESAMADATLAIHLAGAYDVGVVDEGVLESTNVEGTRAFLSAVQSSGVPRAVHVSTIAALGPVERGEGDERTRYSGPFPTVYHRTKTRAHELALAAQADGLPVIIACPAYVYGPGDEGPAGRFLEDLLQRRVPGLPTPSAWFSFVHVDDVAAGLVSVAERGRVGETYVLSGEPATMAGFAEVAARIGGVPGPRLRIPGGIALAFGRVLDAVARATGRRFALSREGVASVTGGRWVHGHAKAAAELGYSARPIEQGLPETIAWAKQRIEADR